MLAVGGAALIAAGIYIIVNQRSRLVSWLRSAVMEAEKLLGTKTGQAKLYTVYAWYCERFPVLASILPFSWFSGLVDSALATFREWYDRNEYINKYVKEGTDGVIYK